MKYNPLPIVLANLDELKDFLNQFLVDIKHSVLSCLQQNWSSLTQIEVCLISTRRQALIKQCLESALGEKNLECIRVFLLTFHSLFSQVLSKLLEEFK